ncbi:uncharacterized protein I303_105357 [Kwoniella dejecticola CBS 10117]|uniref:F-box domain-containing protein n=1 Tax=Kwoniella dejecticola CBS 10117 TaxID=1296121 RepID=A0A1A6A2Q9_9TREE|nr:uncharacterized protein I303_05196 [Kwoniella dejecticola CBS 10117]OBR84338.1 hypothetical protein I303_05196 [Kwoniella dejecticola CBS 10117]
MPPKQTASASSKRSNPTSSKSSPRKKQKPSNTSKAKRLIKVQRSVWNSKDDWDQLVSDSALSTSSVSTRSPRLRGLPTLVKCAVNSISRGFKRLWEIDEGYSFNIAWDFLPPHLKSEVREMVFKWWGSFLTLKILSEVFLVPPHLYLPGELLPSIASANHLKVFIPAPETQAAYTSFTLKHASKATDVGIASVLYHLPNLQSVNLKGCSLASSRTVQTILKRCDGLKKINLKGTKVTEADLKALLDKFGKQLEVFKVDEDVFDDINNTFSSLPFPRITHLSLPGTLLNAPHQNPRYRSSLVGHPQPRATPAGSLIQWSTFDEVFPALTHLCLDGLLIPEDTTILLNSGIEKLDLGSGGPPVPIGSLIRLIESHKDTLKFLSIGHIRSKAASEAEFRRLGEVLGRCTKLEVFKFVTDQHGSRDAICDAGLSRFSNLVYSPGLTGSWSKSLKVLSLSVPQIIESSVFFPYDDGQSAQAEETSPLEHLELPSASIDNTQVFAVALSRFTKLRTLDLSWTTITDDDMKVILEACPLLSRVDLTSCRGIDVRHRRNIFKVKF